MSHWLPSPAVLVHYFSCGTGNNMGGTPIINTSSNNWEANQSFSKAMVDGGVGKTTMAVIMDHNSGKAHSSAGW